MSSIEDEFGAGREAIWFLIVYDQVEDMTTVNFQPRMEPRDIHSLTQPLNPGNNLRPLCLEASRDWALENWDSIIPEGKEVFRRWATKKNDAALLQVAIEGKMEVDHGNER